ncbi:Gfo/Idh/MocA family protein [Niabella aurantiaca]|uniref:Gfo/Idh/MocA family protein n=1 Tax=Niabella aurantiaca TaxID=379900 RepID=UPI00047617D6|nr:Gfo/Idh/MocA family oxidoreductase [Niabella aurantiaca]
MVGHHKIRFAVVGYGHMGRRHAKMIGEHPDCELTAIIDIRGPVESSSVPFYNDLDLFLGSATGAGTDVVIVATPNGLHAAHALKSLSAKKHVLIEKPMALNSADAEAIIVKAADVQRQVYIMMQNRFSPISLWLKEITDSGVLGKIFMVQVNCFWNRDGRYYKKGNWHGTTELDGGVLFTQFSHFVDLLYWCFGGITNIRARMNNFSHDDSIEIEDTSIVHFDFVKGGMGCLNYTTSVWDKNLESSITIIAENGSVKVSGQYMDRIEYCHVNNYSNPDIKKIRSGSGNRTGFTDAEMNHQRFIQYMIRGIRNGDTGDSNGEDGLKVVNIIGRIYRSI